MRLRQDDRHGVVEPITGVVAHLTGEHRLAPSTVRGYQSELRLFSEYLCDGRYGWERAYWETMVRCVPSGD